MKTRMLWLAACLLMAATLSAQNEASQEIAQALAAQDSAGVPALTKTTWLFAHRDTCDLFLDIYPPAEGAQTTFEGKEKPTVIFVFGGGPWITAWA